MKLSSLISALFFLCVLRLYANWGGDAGGSVATGTFRAVGTGQIEMQTENLNIRLYHDRAKVQVDYVLKNAGDAVDVTAGFPCLGVSTRGNNCYEVEDYQLTAGGKPISFRTLKGDVTNWKQVFDEGILIVTEMGGEESELAPRIYWLTSTVHFEKGESKNVQVQYESIYEFSEGGPSGDFASSDDYFRYILSSASTWKGPIQRGRITISTVTIDPDSITIKPGNRFKKTAQGYVWEFTNLKPTLDDNIEVCMNNKSSTIVNYGEGAETDTAPSGIQLSWYFFQGNKYYFDFHGYTPKATSEKPGYPAAYIGDMSNATAWVAGKNGGLNESVTLTLNKPKHVSEIGIVPGYAKSKKLYFANNRVEELEVAVNGSHVVKATLPDEYNASGPGSYKGYALIDLGEYAGDARTITLTVRKVYPGSKYNDTCISEVLLRKRLKEKPQVQGAR